MEEERLYPQYYGIKSKLRLSRDKVVKLLGKDAIYRKIRKWPLLCDEKILNDNLWEEYTEKISNTCVMRNRTFDGDKYDNKTIENEVKVYNGRRNYLVRRIEKKMDVFQQAKTSINTKFTLLTELLQKFHGKIAACGGLIFKAFHMNPKDINGDVDLFFHNCNKDEAEKILIEAVGFLVSEGTKIIDGKESPVVSVTRTEHVTNVTIYFAYNKYYRNKNLPTMIQYQFIHRIYPSLDNILGGFDIGPAMIAYDGYNFYATPLGAWSLVNKALIIDTKRRSTSFEYRIQKYGNKYGCDIIFPGLNHNTSFSKHPQNNPKEISMIQKLIDKLGYYVAPTREFDWEVPNLDDILIKRQVLKDGPILDPDDLRRARCSLKEKIPEHTIRRISDYYNAPLWPELYPIAISTMLRANNLRRVPSLLTFEETIEEEVVIERFKESIENPVVVYDSSIFEEDLYYHDGYESYHKIRLFAEFANDITLDNIEEYKELMIQRMKNNCILRTEQLKGIKWITKNPGRQWTSSINPIIEDPRKWYGPKYIPVLIGVPVEIETTLRLIRLRKCVFGQKKLPKDMFNYILFWIAVAYSDFKSTKALRLERRRSQLTKIMKNRELLGDFKILEM